FHSRASCLLQLTCSERFSLLCRYSRTHVAWSCCSGIRRCVCTDSRGPAFVGHQAAAFGDLGRAGPRGAVADRPCCASARCRVRDGVAVRCLAVEYHSQILVAPATANCFRSSRRCPEPQWSSGTLSLPRTLP